MDYERAAVHRIKALTWVIALCAGAWPCHGVRADEGKASDPGGSGQDAVDEPPDHDPPSPRAVPSYDGRPEPKPTARQRALWVPRVLFFPVYLTLDYLVRYPLGLAVSRAEQHDVPQALMNFFTFGKDDRGMWAPTFAFDFGLKPSGGLVLRVRDLGVKGHRLGIQGSTAGIDWFSGALSEAFSPAGASWTIAWGVRATLRPDGLFLGIGDSIDRRIESRYQYRDITTQFSFRSGNFWRRSHASVLQRWRRMDFGDDVCCGPSITERVQAGVYPTPPGFPDGYGMVGHGASFVLDTRQPRPAPGSGVETTLHGAYYVDVNDPGGRQWVLYGGSAAVFADLTGRNNVIDLTLSAELAEPVRGEVPFTELVSMSGSGPLVGFVGRRLIGASGGALVAEYRWPIWLWLDGSLHFGVGNVFDERFSGFSLDALRMSWGAGVRSSEGRGGSFSLLVAFGTETFAQGPRVDSYRVLLGGTRGL